MRRDPPPAVGPLDRSELPSVVALLRRAKLVGDGLDEHLDTVLVARWAGRIVGCVALEVYDDGALLRSLAVDESMRGEGLGLALTEAAIRLARDRAAGLLYLLTQTATEFFPRFGFRRIPRAAVPPGVKQSVEFTTVCPETAVVMELDLGE